MHVVALAGATGVRVRAIEGGELVLEAHLRPAAALELANELTRAAMALPTPRRNAQREF